MVRKTTIKLEYNHIKNAENSIAPYLLSYSYTDNDSGQADDLQLQLEDREHLWEGEWLPDKGDTIRAAIVAENFEPGKTSELDCGFFDVDEITVAGAPSTVTVKGISTIMSTALRGQENNKSWESIDLKSIANDIAQKAGMEKANYAATYIPTYQRRDQSNQSDLAFLQDLCEKAGLSLKVTNQEIFIFDEEEREQEESIAAYERGKSDILSYSFTSKSRDIYNACIIQYKDPQTGQPFKYTYEPPNAPKTGQTLKINERVDDAEEGKILARKRLREKNLKENSAQLTVIGNTELTAGKTIDIQGFGSFNGKYYITQTKHSYGGSGYTTDLTIHKTLGSYYENAAADK